MRAGRGDRLDASPRAALGGGAEAAQLCTGVRRQGALGASRAEEGGVGGEGAPGAWRARTILPSRWE